MASVDVGFKKVLIGVYGNHIFLKWHVRWRKSTIAILERTVYAGSF